MKINTPELNNSIIGWIYNASYRNLWKVNKWYDFEDLVQDGLMIALKCRVRYGSDISPAHFISLVQTSFRNHIIDLQRHNCSSVEYQVVDLEGKSFTSEIEAFDSLREPEFPEQEIACALNELPEPIKAVLRLFLSPESLRKLRLPMRETLTESETPAKRLNRLANWPEDRNFESELEKLLFYG